MSGRGALPIADNSQSPWEASSLQRIEPSRLVVGVSARSACGRLGHPARFVEDLARFIVATEYHGNDDASTTTVRVYYDTGFYSA